MAFDPRIADRIREAVAAEPAVTERKMFGGLAFLVGGHMALAASSKGGLMIRVDPVSAPLLVNASSADYVVMRGRQMKGWLHLEPAAIESDTDFSSWTERALAYATTLPPKTVPNRPLH